MSSITIILFVASILMSICLFIYFSSKKQILGQVLTFAFAMRATLGFLIEMSQKYFFVLDNIGYERRALQLAQIWQNPGTVLYAYRDESLYGLYERLLGMLFYAVGEVPYVGVLANSLMSVLAIFFIFKITEAFFESSDESPSEINKKIPVVVAIIASLYPSYVIWSSVNIRDPLYLLLAMSLVWFFVKVFSKNSHWSWMARLGGLAAIASLYVLILEVRNYVGWLYVTGLVGGFLLAWYYEKLAKSSYIKGALIPITLVLSGLYVFSSFFASDFQNLLTEIEHTRSTFLNIGLHEFAHARSAFLADYTFASLGDLLKFIPLGLTYFFFAPFPWEISTSLQLFALPEVLLIYLLTIPTLIGIKISYSRNRFDTVLILFFCLLVAVGQSFAIGNMGTIFRHRTLAMLLLSIFTGVGIVEIWYQGRKAFR